MERNGYVEQRCQIFDFNVWEDGIQLKNTAYVIKSVLQINKAKKFVAIKIEVGISYLVYGSCSNVDTNNLLCFLSLLGPEYLSMY